MSLLVRLWGLGVIGITLFMFYHSLQPADVSNEYSRGLLVYLYDLLGAQSGFSNNFIRKTAHFMEYFVQAFLLCGLFSALKMNKKHCLGYILFFCLFTAVIDENIQLYAPGRAGMVQDVVLDFLGGLSGIAVFFVVRYMYRKQRR